jgi:hypothetical protein
MLGVKEFLHWAKLKLHEIDKETIRNYEFLEIKNMENLGLCIFGAEKM